MKNILFCKKCYVYTLKNNCPNCDNKTVSQKPAKFSIEDKYLKYRLIAKQNEISG
jgi:H/ACA ribonucleoprotein complex subunit 3